MLAEIEAARSLAARPLRLWLLTQLLLGAALLAYAGYGVFEEFVKAKGQLAEKDVELRAREMEIARLNDASRGGATLASAAFTEIESAEKRKRAAAALASNPELAAKTPRGVIHFPKEGQRQLAEKGARVLTGSGFIVMGVENTPEKIDDNEVRYYRMGDKGQAEQTAQILTDGGLADFKLNLVEKSDVTPGQLDILIARRQQSGHQAPAPDPPATPSQTPTPKPTPPPVDSTADNDRVFKSSEVTTKAVVTSKPNPPFTDEARKNNVSGKVRLRLILSASGEVKVTGVDQGLPHGLTEQAIAFARQIKFRPARKDGRNVSQYAVVEYTFNLY